MSALSGAVFSKSFPARGMAVGDLDNDGDVDVLVINNGEAPVLLAQRGWKSQQLARTATRLDEEQSRRCWRCYHLAGWRGET